jgi:hypothetical protein
LGGGWDGTTDTNEEDWKDGEEGVPTDAKELNLPTFEHHGGVEGVVVGDEGRDIHRDDYEDGRVEEDEEPIDVFVPAEVWVDSADDSLGEHCIDGEEHNRTVQNSNDS